MDVRGARPVELPDLRDCYVDLVRLVRDEGEPAEPRGYKTRELRGVTFTLTDTRRALPYGVGRGLRPEIGYAEALLLCAGIASPSLLTSASGQFLRFLDGGVHHGAYGPRVRPQLGGVVELLRRDPDSRQAVVEVYDPRYDQQDVRDVPCTLGFQFLLRPDGLHMFSTMRSQDVYLGLGYDAFMFAQLGHTVANVLGVALRTLTHHVRSLHLYERNREAIDGLHYTKLRNRTTEFFEPRGFGCPEGHASYEAVRERALAVYEKRPIPTATNSEAWYGQTLAGLERLSPASNFAA